MLKQILRFVAGLVVGIIVTFVLLALVELFSAVVHPVPAGFQGTQEEMCEHVARYPHWVLAVVVPLWGVTAWFGTWCARRIGNRPAAFVIGLLLVAGVLVNATMLPYPLWFKLVIIPVVTAAAWQACKVRGSGQA